MALKIREVREAKHLSQGELADKAHVSRSLINMLERGKLTETSTATLTKLAEALDCQVGDIFTGPS